MSVRLHLHVKNVNTEEAQKKLDAFREKHGEKVTGVNDIFSLGMLLADYEIEINENHILRLLSKDKFLSTLVLSTYITNENVVLSGGETIAVYHPILDILAFISLSTEPVAFVTYTTPKDLTNKKNVILVAGPSGDWTGHALANELSNKGRYDRIMLGSDMNLSFVPGTIEEYQVPEKYVWGFRPKKAKS